MWNECEFSVFISFVLVPVSLILSVCVSMHGYVLPCKCVYLIVNIWGPQAMRAYRYLGLIFLEMRKKK